MNLLQYFEDRKHGELSCEKIIGENRLEKCAVINENYKDIFEDVETGILVQACESCAYSSNELKIFKTGLQAFRLFISSAAEEYRMKQEIKEQKKKEKKHKPMY